MLLLTFVCFFVVSGNLGRVDAVKEFLQSLLDKFILLTSVATSQIISNVPAAVLLSGFTDNWQELLAGVNIGGLGTPVASLASLITLKLYMNTKGAKVLKFLGVFTLANIVGLIVLLVFEIICI
jgi:Na+/H+ antiporter NhaD/arsenite permease-like protein